MDNNKIVNNIKTLCRENHVSISQLEQDLYMSSGLISRWRKNVPTLDRIVDIANYFHVPVDAILGSSVSITNKTGAISTLLNILYKKSLHFDIDWEVLNSHKLPPNLPVSSLSFITDEPTADCFYCSVNNGYFFLKINQVNSSLQLSFYVLASANSIPVLKSSNTEELMPLYEHLLTALSKELNRVKTDNFINTFIAEMQDTTSEFEHKIVSLNSFTNRSSV